MKLQEWAKSKGIHRITAWRLYKNGKLPFPSEKIGGIIYVYPSGNIALKNNVAIYARVSSREQKDDGERQLERLRNYCASKGLKISREILEIGSGLNGYRQKLLSILGDNSIDLIVVEHKDRLSRFGFEYIESALNANGRKIEVMNDSESKKDIMQDFIDVVTCLCASIYGKRSAENKAKKAIRAVEE